MGGEEAYLPAVDLQQNVFKEGDGLDEGVGKGGVGGRGEEDGQAGGAPAQETHGEEGEFGENRFERDGLLEALGQAG